MPAIHLLILALCMCACGLFILFVFCLSFLFVFFLLPFLYVLPFLLSLTFQNMDPLLFQAGGRRRRPNLGLVCVDIVFSVFLVKDACLFFVVVCLV